MVRQKQQYPANRSRQMPLRPNFHESSSSSGVDSDEVGSTSSTVGSSSAASREQSVSSSEMDFSPVVEHVMSRKPSQAEMSPKSRSPSPSSSNADNPGSAGEQLSASSPKSVRDRKARKSMSRKQDGNTGKLVKPSKKVSRKKKSTVLEEIAFYQKTTHLLLLKRPFGRVVREILQNMAPGFRVGGGVFDILQEAAEAFLVGRFEDAVLLAVHANRTTVMVKDLQLAKRLAYSPE